MKGVEDILSCYEEWLERMEETMSVPAVYHLAEEIVGDLTYQTDEIRLFSQKVSDLEEGRLPPQSGLFLSRLVNNCPDEKVTLEIEERGAKIDYLGYFNRRQLFIQGDAGYFLGEQMRKGQIKVSGTVKGLGKVRGGMIFSGSHLLFPRGIRRLITGFKWPWKR